MKRCMRVTALAVGMTITAIAAGVAQTASDLAKIETVVVIYAENRSFDNLYGAFL
jgi:phospholipase C